MVSRPAEQFRLLYFVLFASICCGAPAPPPAPAGFDCKTRHLALEYAQKIQPFRGKSDFDTLAAVLDEPGGLPGGVTQCDNVTYTGPDREFQPTFALPSGTVFHVDVAGSDVGTGDLSHPFATVGRALSAWESVGKPSGGIALHQGVHYLQTTLSLSAKHSGLSIQNYNGETAWLSGATKVEAKWSAAGTKNVWVTDVPASISEISGLRISSERAVRARYPNGCTSTTVPLPSGYVCGGVMKNGKVVDPNDGFGSNLITDDWVRPEAPTMNSTKTIEPEQPLRSSGLSFQKFNLGIGGTCSQFDPPAGYWCGNDCMGGAPKPPGCIPRWPAGFAFNSTLLPNAPPGGYKNAERMVVQAWHPGHWASWMFSTQSMNSTHVMFGRGGFQGARGGYAGSRLADSFFVENVLEELDADNEFYFDEDAKKLYYYSSAGAPTGLVEALGTLKTLISIQGDQESPVKGVSLLGLGLRDAALSYLDAHSMPSGGDWGLGRVAALFVKGSEDTLVDSCTFEKIDSSAVLLNGYNRYVTIQNSNFHEIGDNMIGLLGETEGVPEAYGMGWDGTKGNQPRFTRVLRNFAYRCGLFEKQSSFYFQAKSAQNLIQDNIFFHGPRAGMNFNDGFGGGSLLEGNLMFNTVMESGDHGPFNSWDRQVYLTDVKDGTPSVDKAFDEIRSNFFIGNWYGQEAIDNDDGSCYYNTHHNFFAYGGTGMKNDFNGHDNHHHHNLYAYINKGMGICGALPGHADQFFSNKVIQVVNSSYASYDCACNGTCPVMHDNHIFTPDGTMDDVCGKTMAQRQAEGMDVGSMVDTHPSDELVISWARELLGLVI